MHNRDILAKTSNLEEFHRPTPAGRSISKIRATERFEASTAFRRDAENGFDPAEERGPTSASTNGARQKKSPRGAGRGECVGIGRAAGMRFVLPLLVETKDRGPLMDSGPSSSRASDVLPR